MMRKHFTGAVVGLSLAMALSLVAQAQWTITPQTGRFINVKRLPKENPELQVEYARSLMLNGEYKKALDETDKFTRFYGKSDQADRNQFLRGEIRMAQGDFKAAAKDFQQVITAYPDSKLYDQVIAKEYEIGDKFYEQGDKNLKKGWWRPLRKRPFKRAIETYTMVIDNQPFTAAAAQAQYKVGLCHFTLEEYTEAAYEYQRVIEDYSGSDYVADASYGLALCYYNDALEPNYDQAPSYLAVSAMDDFKARFPDDARNADMQGKRVEMRESIADQRLNTAQFYEKRRKFDAARIYYNVVVDQFPETEAAASARDWLVRYGATNPEVASAPREPSAAEGVRGGKKASS